MTESASGTWTTDGGHGTARRSCAGKSRWSGWEIGAMVAGFVIFWPLGLAALGLKLVRGEMWPGAKEGAKPWDAFKFDAAPGAKRGWSFAANFGGHSGNTAFEDYKRGELERLENERRKLMEEQKAFREFVEQVRKAKDQDEFDRFMAGRKSPPPPPSE